MTASTVLEIQLLQLHQEQESSAGDIVNFGDQYEYRVISVSTNDLTIVRKEEPAYFVASDSSGLHAVITDGAQVRRRWRHYDLFDKAPGTSPYAQSVSGVLMTNYTLLY